MNRYLIKNKIETVAELPRPFESEGYSFSSYTANWWDCNAWVASKEIEAISLIEARKEFIVNLIPLVEKCSVISQCAFRFHATSYFIYKLTNNPRKIIFLYLVDNVGHTGLHFDEECIQQLPKMNKIPNKHAFMYIMEATNATTYYTRLVMLFSAVEALAGEISNNKMVKKNDVEMKRILGEDLFSKLYGYRGLRNKLLHGNYGSHNLFDGLIHIIYKKVLSYLCTNYDIQFDEGIIHPQRNFSDNYTELKISMEFVNQPIFDLNEIEIIMSDRRRSRVKQSDIFNYISKLPPDY